MFWLTYIFFYLPAKIFLPTKVYGRENIRKKETFILAGNHQSVFDPVVLDYSFKRRNVFLAKYELFKKKFNKFFLGKILGGIPVNRAKGLTLSQTKQIFKILSDNKENLCIFPEGTRRDDLNQDDDIKGGTCMFAIKAKKPIMPFYIISNKLCRKHILIVGKPFELSEFYDKKLDKDLLSKADEVLKSKIIELKDEYERNLREKELVKELKRQKRKKKHVKSENV